MIESRPNFDWASFWQALFSILACLCLWSLAGLLIALSLLEQTIKNPFLSDSSTVLLFAWGSFVPGLLLLPSAYYAIRRLTGNPVSETAQSGNKFYLIPVGIAVWILFLLSGYWFITDGSKTNWIVVSINNTFVIGLPILLLWRFGHQNLSIGSPQRAWGVFSVGMVLGPFFIFIAEVLIIAIVAGVAGIIISTQSNLINEFSNVAQRLQDANLSTQAISRIITPYLTKPVTIFITLTVGAGLIPVIEELLKPIGVWMLANRQLSPAEGFIAGLISGAGYAFFEGFNALIAADNQMWLTTAIGRAGTSLLHILTTGLMGWALCSAWKDRKFLQLGVTYFLSVSIHALWNGLNFGMGFNILIQQNQNNAALIDQIGVVAPIGFLILVLIMLLMLLRANHTLRNML